MVVNVDQFLWVEKYRPKTVRDCILPEQLKQTFQEFVDKKSISNLILSGGPGVGKTTVAKAMLEEIGADYIVINGSMNGNIDTLRNEIKEFASTVSFSSTRKYVILDEADYLNPQSTQPALRNFMEEYSNNCGFILTCNYKNRIISPLHSRCSVIDFNIPKEQRPSIAAQFYKKTLAILTQEQIVHNTKVVAQLINRYFPDWRRLINELQRYSQVGIIDSGILANHGEESINALIGFLKNKNFTETRKWVAQNSDIDSSTIFRMLYDNVSTQMKPHSVAQLVILLADYQYKAVFVADQEINLMACFTEIMTDCEFN